MKPKPWQSAHLSDLESLPGPGTLRWTPIRRGFGITAFLLFLVPLMNVLALPGAVVGATLLVRRLSGDPAGRPGPP